MSSVWRRYTRIVLWILPLLWALAPIGVLRAADCPSSTASMGGRVDPSACVAYGTHVALQVTEFAPGQLRSVVLRGPHGLVGGGDRSLRVDHTGRLVLQTTNYFGTRLGSGQYTAWIKDPSGTYPPAQLVFWVHGGDQVATTTTQPTGTPRPSATPSPVPTSAVARTRLPSAPAGTAAPATPSATATARATAKPGTRPTAKPGTRPTATPPAAATGTSPVPNATPTPSPTAVPPAARGDHMQILVVEPDWIDDGELTEYVVLHNGSDAPIALAGWSLGDDDGQRVELPARTVAGGSFMWIWSGAGVDDEANVYLGQRAAMWDIDGDVAVLHNAVGEEAARFAY